MGIDALWPKILRGESEEYIEKKPLENVKTVFVDGQVMLMKSTIPPHVKTWDDFVTYNFTTKLQRLHWMYDTVIISFDNYSHVPIYKSIEQTKRIAMNKTPFNFERGDAIPEKPPPSHVWSDALLNRTYKTVLISIITKILAAKYCPPMKPRTLVLDFCNVVKISYTNYGCKREVIEFMKSMGESDVKFLRYISIYGPILVDSIDSDVLLIAMQFMQKNNMQIDIFVRRMASKTIEASQEAAAKRKAEGKQTRKTEYEIINVKKLVATIHIAIRQSVGEELVLSPHQMTRFAVFLMLITGSDYSRKMPSIGPSFVWENLHISIPLLALCIEEGDTEFTVNENACMDLLFSALYREKFQKHVKEDSSSFDQVVNDLQTSKLAERTKRNLPSRVSITCLIRSVVWTMKYWELPNDNPPVEPSGIHGFVLRDGKVEFGLEV